MSIEMQSEALSSLSSAKMQSELNHLISIEMQSELPQ